MLYENTKETYKKSCQQVNYAAKWQEAVIYIDQQRVFSSKMQPKSTGNCMPSSSVTMQLLLTKLILYQRIVINFSLMSRQNDSEFQKSHQDLETARKMHLKQPLIKQAEQLYIAFLTKNANRLPVTPLERETVYDFKQTKVRVQQSLQRIVHSKQ